MAFCPHCGTQINEGSKFCISCGAPIAAPQPSPQHEQPNQQQDTSQHVQQPSYQPHSYAQPTVEHPEYQQLGGWLLFFTICWGISALSELASLVPVFQSLGSITTFGFGSRLVLPMLLVLLTTLLSIAICVLMVVLIVKRNQMFLRLYQIASLAEMATGLLSAVAMGFAVSQYGVGDFGISIGGGMGSILGLVLMTMYFCKSVRVRTYMGSTDYLDMALFKIGA